jgi:hypothetical protein
VYSKQSRTLKAFACGSTRCLLQHFRYDSKPLMSGSTSNAVDVENSSQSGETELLSPSHAFISDKVIITADWQDRNACRNGCSVSIFIGVLRPLICKANDDKGFKNHKLAATSPTKPRDFAKTVLVWESLVPSNLRWGLEVGPGLARCNGVLEFDQALHAGSIDADLQHVVQVHNPKTRQLSRPEPLRGTHFCQIVAFRTLRTQTEQGDACTIQSKSFGRSCRV